MVVTDGADIALTNNATVFGATSTELIVTEVIEASHEGEMYYYVIITNDAGFVESNIVTITVGKFMFKTTTHTHHTSHTKTCSLMYIMQDY